MSTSDPFSVLGVSRTATAEQIDTAFLFLAGANDPAMFADPATKAKAVAAREQIAAAYAEIQATRDQQSLSPVTASAEPDEPIDIYSSHSPSFASSPEPTRQFALTGTQLVLLYFGLLFIFLCWVTYRAAHDPPTPRMRALMLEQSRQDMDSAIDNYNTNKRALEYERQNRK